MDLQKGIKNYDSLLVCNDRKAFFNSSDQSAKHFGHVRMCATPYPISWIMFILDLGPYRQFVGIPMGTNCAPLVADLFLFCYERDFLDSLLLSMIIKLMLSRLSIALLGTSMAF